MTVYSDKFWRIGLTGMVFLLVSACANQSTTPQAPAGPTLTGALFLEKHRYQILADGSVLQETTGLIWEASDNGNRYNLEVAVERCKNAQSHGKSDWRLPDRYELASLLDYTLYGPAADPVLNMRPESYWSSSVFAENVYETWFVNFMDGAVLVQDLASLHHVRCVRSEK